MQSLLVRPVLLQQLPSRLCLLLLLLPSHIPVPEVVADVHPVVTAQLLLLCIAVVVTAQLLSCCLLHHLLLLHRHLISVHLLRMYCQLLLSLSDLLVIAVVDGPAAAATAAMHPGHQPHSLLLLLLRLLSSVFSQNHVSQVS